MPRYKITVEYDGTGLAGWQAQQEVASVQGLIEEAIEKFTKEKVVVYGAGRTDAGVHAKGQVAHFDLQQDIEIRKLRESINHFLKGNKIILTAAEKVNEEFHARFSAKKRYYVYKILQREVPSVLDENRLWHVWEKLDVSAMRKAASYMEGQHDFTSLRSSECQAKSPVKTIDEIKIEEVGEEIQIHVKATSFLHNMVRNIVGTLKFVGTGKIKPEDIKEIIAAKDRSKAGPTAPPSGLYFMKVDY